MAKNKVKYSKSPSNHDFVLKKMEDTRKKLELKLLLQKIVFVFYSILMISIGFIIGFIMPLLW